MLTQKNILELICLVCGPVTLQTDLLKEELLDSFALITIVSELEAEGVELHPTQLGFAAFSTPQKIIALVQNQTGPLP
ncbi:MAG: phosphopantetheine-binding protein [Pygmaiobacter massiliensis]|nr:phosphopantetheine-binding protein [Pygmaiobacter massiliensis]